METVVFLFFLVIAVGFLCRWMHEAFKSISAARWPTVIGTMNSYKVGEIRDSNEAVFSFNVNYSYEVLGQKYRGNRLSFFSFGSSRSPKNTRLHEKLSKARTVKVRYNPKNPSESSLSYGLTRSAIGVLMFFLMWLLLAAAFATFWVLNDKPELINRIEVLKENRQKPMRGNLEDPVTLNRTMPRIVRVYDPGRDIGT